MAGVSFFAGGNGSAFWTNTTSNDSDPFSMQLDVPDTSSYAGITLHHVSGMQPPANPPSFDYKVDQTGPSGGSPRLVIQFTSPAGTTLYIDLRPLAWTADTSKTESGSSNDWDLMNSGVASCPAFEYEQSYSSLVSTVESCDPGAVVQSAYVVADNFAYVTGYTAWIDNLQYAGKTISQPSDNAA